MATIKSYTDISQSKKLAEILPLESADMKYKEYTSSLDYSSKHCVISSVGCPHSKDLPCWSLTALLDVLPTIRKGEDIANPFISKTPDGEYYIVYATLTEEVDSSAIYDNPVDACVAMIEKLHDSNLL